MSLKANREALRVELLSRVPDTCGPDCRCGLDAPSFMCNDGCYARAVVQCWDWSGRVPGVVWAVMTVEEQWQVCYVKPDHPDRLVFQCLAAASVLVGLFTLCLGAWGFSVICVFLVVVCLMNASGYKSESPFAWMTPPFGQITAEGRAERGALSLPALDTDKGALTISPTQDGALSALTAGEQDD